MVAQVSLQVLSPRERIFASVLRDALHRRYVQTVFIDVIDRVLVGQVMVIGQACERGDGVYM